MAHYVDKASQTLIAGLTRDPAARPAALCPPTDTPTPPDDMAIEKMHLPKEAVPPIKTNVNERNMQPSQLLKRKNRPPMVARISLPASEFDPDTPRSPPPTDVVMSPLPAANTLHAGHTPIIPRALSPLPQDEPSGPRTPEQEEALSGPLTLPPQPGDGAEDTIPLSVLDAELEKLRIEQEHEDEQSEPSTSENQDAQAPDPIQSAETEHQRSRKSSEDARRRPSADEVEAVDGVLLKKPRINFGAPLGQA